SVERLHRCWADPEVIVDDVREELIAGNLADARARLVAESACHFDLAELAGVQELDGLPNAGVAPALGAGLADAVGLPGYFDQPAALADVVADGLFDIDILARLHGPDGRQGMPVV